MFKETFRSNFWGTKTRAQEILCEIRALHSEEKGWHEDDAYLEERVSKNGTKEYRAVRVHHKED
ncbi:MAG: hypothetical protein IJ220_01200 [Clostridia bacterium]|nr:hypothetical protein [Clostridia bacterium]